MLLAGCLIVSMAFSWYGNKIEKRFVYKDLKKDNKALIYVTACGSTIPKDPCGISQQLDADPGLAGYLWSTGESGQNITVTSSGIYWWDVPVGNLVVNGDFTSGATGFTSDYSVRTTNSPGQWGPLSDEGTYLVGTNPINYHTQFTSYTDHTNNTSGNRNMLIVNGASVKDVNVWSETNLTIQKNTTYIFSIWIRKASPDSPADLKFSINNTLLGHVVGTDDWTNFSVEWDSKNSTKANISIVNQNTIAQGNDFSLDDIVFAPTCRRYFNVTFHTPPSKPAIAPN